MTQFVMAPEKKSSGVFIVAGTVALDGSNPTDVTIPCQEILLGVASISVAAPLALSTSTLGVTWSGKTLTIEGYKPTGAGDTTLVDSDGTQTVAYFALCR